MTSDKDMQINTLVRNNNVINTSISIRYVASMEESGLRIAISGPHRGQWVEHSLSETEALDMALNIISVYSKKVKDQLKAIVKESQEINNLILSKLEEEE